jgi:hypothetical protein
VGTESAHLKLVKPDGGDGYDTATAAANLQKIDDHPGIKVCSTAQRPGPADRWIGQVIFDTDEGGYLRWNGTIWTPFRGLTFGGRVVRSGGLSVPNDTDTYAKFNVVERDTGNMVDLVADDEILACTVTEEYDVALGVHWLEGNAAGYRYAAIVRNGTDIIAEDTRVPVVGRPTTLAISRPVALTVGDTLRLRLRHTDGAGLSYASATPSVSSTFLSAVMR